MLAIGSTSPISAKQELVASRKGLNEKIGRLADGVLANFQVRDPLAEKVNIVHMNIIVKDLKSSQFNSNAVIMNARSLLDR